MEVTFLIAIATMGGLGFLFAGGLAIADKKLRVEEDPKIAKVNDILPGANCGGCSKAGCYDFAVGVVDGSVPINGCPVGGSETAADIAKILGVEVQDSVKMVPRVLCKGGNIEAAKKSTEYYGPLSCSAMHIVAGGNKKCSYGCLGGGDCVEACPFDAMVMNDDGLPEVIEDLCTSCGMCVKACPRDIIEMHPIDRNVFVFCKNHDDPKTSKEVCDVACLGCGICARKSDGAIEMDTFLPIVDYDKLDETIIPFDKCRTGAIGHLREVPKEESVTDEQ